MKSIAVFLLLFITTNLTFGALAFMLNIKQGKLAAFMIITTFLSSLFLTKLVSRKIASNKQQQLFKPGNRKK